MITGRGESETFRNPNNGASHMIIEEAEELRRSNEKEIQMHQPLSSSRNQNHAEEKTKGTRNGKESSSKQEKL